MTFEVPLSDLRPQDQAEVIAERNAQIAERNAQKCPKIAELEDRLDAIDGRLDEQRLRLVSRGEWMLQLEKRLKVDIPQVSERMDALESRLDAIDSRLDEADEHVGSRLESVSLQFASHLQRLDALESRKEDRELPEGVQHAAPSIKLATTEPTEPTEESRRTAALLEHYSMEKRALEKIVGNLRAERDKILGEEDNRQLRDLRVHDEAAHNQAIATLRADNAQLRDLRGHDAAAHNQEIATLRAALAEVE